jgi:hypothetical protein
VTVARTKCANSLAFGLYGPRLRLPAAQAGAGPVSAICTCIPRARAATTIWSYEVKSYLIFLGFFRALADLLPTTAAHSTFTRMCVALSVCAWFSALSRL